MKDYAMTVYFTDGEIETIIKTDNGDGTVTYNAQRRNYRLRRDIPAMDEQYILLIFAVLFENPAYLSKTIKEVAIL